MAESSTTNGAAAAQGKPKRHVKVLKLRILKPVEPLTWDELGALLRNARYRTFRLANLAISESYLAFHLHRTGKAEEIEPRKIAALNRELREYLAGEREKEASKRTQPKIVIDPGRFSKTGALPDTVVSALSNHKLKGLNRGQKWNDVLRGKASLPSFRLNMAIPVRCDKSDQRRLKRIDDGDVEVDLMICTKPYPRVKIATGHGALGDSGREILDRLLANPDQKMDGWRQRNFEIKYDEQRKAWHLFVTYDFPASETTPDEHRVVGVDLGWACPLYAATGHGHARLGWRQFQPLAARIRALQTQTMARRRSMQRGGKKSLGNTARTGHGRKRTLAPTEKLQGRIDRAYTTLNHQLSAAVVKFAHDQGAGVIQMEKLDGLQDVLSGTFLGGRWRYHQLQNFIQYKAREAAIEVKMVDPRYTSRRCSQCGWIHLDFTREYRDKQKAANGKSAKFECPKCHYVADADYNAARNLAVLDIDAIIGKQLQDQGRGDTPGSDEVAD